MDKLWTHLNLPECCDMEKIVSGRVHGTWCTPPHRLLFLQPSSGVLASDQRINSILSCQWVDYIGLLCCYCRTQLSNLSSISIFLNS